MSSWPPMPPSLPMPVGSTSDKLNECCRAYRLNWLADSLVRLEQIKAQIKQRESVNSEWVPVSRPVRESISPTVVIYFSFEKA